MILWLAPPAHAGQSWQVWFDQTADQALSEKWSARAGQSFRYDCDSEELTTYFIEGGLFRSLQSWLDAGLMYHQQYDRREGRWVEENRPCVEATVRWKTDWVTLSDRNRMEYRYREDQEDITRYRNKLTLQFNLLEEKVGLKPYVSAEVFADASARLAERDRTRFAIGLRTDPEKRLLRNAPARWTQHLTMDYYLMQQSIKREDRWTDDFVVGVQVGFRF